MEERKQKEIEYYNKKAEELLKDYNPPKDGSSRYAGSSRVPTASSQPTVGPLTQKKYLGDFEGFEPKSLESFKFCYKLLKENCQDKIVLDYGCGNGIHSAFPAKMGAKKVIGIDLSEKSLEIAKERIKREGLEGKVEFLKMDCEKMDFSDNFFDVIFDGGTFSSLDIKKAYPELARVLKPQGYLLGIETFGHNPIANLKRKINKLTGKRTEWAATHIFKEKDLEMAKDYFGKIKTYFFHPVSCLIFPFLDLPGGKLLLKFFEFIDKILLGIPFLRKYAFKVVFVFSLVRK